MSFEIHHVQFASFYAPGKCFCLDFVPICTNAAGGKRNSNLELCGLD